jgi:hypothetical protein
MKHLINLGSQFIGFRDEADALKGKISLFLMTRFFTKHLFCLVIMGVHPLDYFFQMRSAEPKNALMHLQLSWSSAKKLKQMPLLLRVSIRGFKLLRML